MRTGESPTKPRLMRVEVCSVEVHGSADKITFEVRGYRDLKSGSTEYLRIDLASCRWSVKHLLAELKSMHARDRERIAAELARIDNETKALLP